MAGMGIFGAIGAAFLVISLPASLIKLYIAISLFLIGVYLFKRKKIFKFSWKKILGISSIGAFNKGMSGGGYGPIAIGGLILSGIEPREAVASVLVAEGIVSFAGFMIYLFSTPIQLLLIVPILLGSALAVPFSSLLLSKLPGRLTKRLIGAFIIALSVALFIKVLI